MSSSWETRAKKAATQYFWDWKTIEKVRTLRAYYLRASYIKDKIYTIEELLTPELLRLMRDMNAPTTSFPLSRRIFNRGTTATSPEIKTVNLTMECKPSPLDAGHYGYVFDYAAYQPGSVVKFFRYESSIRPIDVYSYLMETFLALLIHCRGFECTPHIYGIVKSQEAGDPGCVMERLHQNLSRFFLRDIGAKDQVAGLLVLSDVVAKLHILQREFTFRHRDFRMKNIMIAGDTVKQGCIRIVDFGKASLVFQGREYSAYPGRYYEDISEDFDLAYFFAEMLIHFLREPTFRNQVILYEGILSPFLQGFEYEDLIHDPEYLMKLMDRVDKRDFRTKRLSQPKYVWDQLQGELRHLQGSTSS